MLSSRGHGRTPGPGDRAQSARRENTNIDFEQDDREAGRGHMEPTSFPGLSPTRSTELSLAS